MPNCPPKGCEQANSRICRFEVLAEDTNGNICPTAPPNHPHNLAEQADLRQTAVVTSPLDKRRQSLEDEFFHKEDAEKLKALRADLKDEEAKAKLAEVTGMTDDQVLDGLVEMGIKPDTMLALSLVPLIHVAWADGEIQTAERDSIMIAARSKGIKQGSPTHDLLERWLSRQPKPSLFEAWQGYIMALKPMLSDTQIETLRNQVLYLAEQVAESAGGVLGFFSVERSEKSVINDIRSTLE